MGEPSKRTFSPSPSLRGSGLKCSPQSVWLEGIQSPSLRGSGLKSIDEADQYTNIGLPLYEGVDWNCLWAERLAAMLSVSLFTREWIEMSIRVAVSFTWESLPLYEGVDWNKKPLCIICYFFQSPSLRGSGLKWMLRWLFVRQRHVSLFTREWIEIPPS